MGTRWPSKLIIGLTGNIATGKSAVMRMAADHGAFTLDADHLVHEILEGNPDVQGAIQEAFGSSVLRVDGRINREVLGKIVFSNPEALKRLEQIVHPAVRQRLFALVDNCEATVVVIEAIKLLEGSLASECDQIWVTRCPVPTQIERLRVCRGMDEETARMRVKAQSAQAEKVAMADVVIDTNGTMADTKAFFEMAWRRLEKERPHSPISVISRDTTPDGVTVRRARPSDVPSILLLMQQATGGTLKMKRTDMLMALGERGYVIGQSGTQVSAVAGWSSENLIARIEQIYVYPPDAAQLTGAAVLQEIEDTARQLICEVIIALLPDGAANEIDRLFREQGFEALDEADLPNDWQSAVNEIRSDGTFVLIKVLRDTRLN